MKVHGERKNVALIGLGASVIGSVVMYLFDPVVGRRRRAVARDKVLRLSRKSREGADTAARDFLNRARGFLAEARNVSERKDLPDSKLADRIRAKLGLMVSHPASIQVHAENGNVTLNGPILESEVDRLLARIASMPGVARVENRLEVHASPDSVPGLQGQPRSDSI